MLWEEMEKYTELTGEDATHVPIIKIGAYLDGYEKGTEVLDKIRAEIDNALSDGMIHKKTVLGIIDKYKAEGSDKA